MSAVVEAVSNVVSDVFDAVGDVVESAVEFVGDVVEKVGDVVEAVIEDPLPVLLSVAGSFVGIPPYVTMGALSAARGGDLEDIALSMGTAYFAPQVGNALSSTMSSTFVQAGMNETFSQVASNSISQGLVNGTVAEVRGGSFEDGFAGGFTGGMVAGGVNEVASYVKPDIIRLAQESGLDLKDSTALYNAGTRAFSEGIGAEVSGKGDFVTAFSNSAVGSGIDYGARSLNATIDEQFETAITDWNKKDPEGEPVEVAKTGAGIPDEVVGQVTVSGYGVENDADTFDSASVLAEYQGESDVNNASSSYTGEKSTSDVAVLPETLLAEAPIAETDDDFSDFGPQENLAYSNMGLDDFEGLFASSQIPEDVADIAKALPSESAPVSEEPVGALAVASDAVAPDASLTEANKPAVVSEAPVSDNLLTAGLAQDAPVGGLNAVAQADQAAQATPQAKMASSMGIKPTDFTKPLVATAGNLLKQALTQKKRPPPRAPMARPAGGLQMAKAKPVAKPVAPPQRMDVAQLIPVQKAAPTRPPKTLASTAKLSPVSNIAGLTSMVKKTG
jgi:hypothetical protein